MASLITDSDIRVAMDLDESARIAAGAREVSALSTGGANQAAHDGYLTGVDPLLRILPRPRPREVIDLLTQPVA